MKRAAVSGKKLGEVALQSKKRKNEGREKTDASSAGFFRVRPNSCKHTFFKASEKTHRGTESGFL